MKKRNILLIVLVTLVVVLAGLFLRGRSERASSADDHSSAVAEKRIPAVQAARVPAKPADISTQVDVPAVDPEEAKVEAFDGLTDVWAESAKTNVTMKDVAAFVAAFHQIPKDRQDECIHRALNLIPDANIMLLVGVLMDKTLDKGITKAVFDDIVNRDESVKMPILRQISQDKAHPCQKDAAWILEKTN